MMLQSEPLALCVFCSENEPNEVKVLHVCSCAAQTTERFTFGFLVLSIFFTYLEPKPVCVLRYAWEIKMKIICVTWLRTRFLLFAFLPHINDSGDRIKRSAINDN